MAFPRYGPPKSDRLLAYPMSRKSIDLLVATDPGWVSVIVDNFDEFLCDHANCERRLLRWR